MKTFNVNNQEFFIDFHLKLITNVLNPNEIFNIPDLPKLNDTTIGIPFDNKSGRLAFEFAPMDTITLYPVPLSIFDKNIN